MHIPEKVTVLAERLRSHGCAFTESMFFPTAGGSRRLRSDADGHCIEFWRWDVAGPLDESAERAGRPDDSSVRWLVAVTSISGRTSDQNITAIRRARMSKGRRIHPPAPLGIRDGFAYRRFSSMAGWLAAS